MAMVGRHGIAQAADAVDSATAARENRDGCSRAASLLPGADRAAPDWTWLAHVDVSGDEDLRRRRRVTSNGRDENASLALWSGRTFWQSAAGRVMVRLLQDGMPVTTASVVAALREQLAEPEQEYRAPAIQEAIRRIGAIGPRS